VSLDTAFGAELDENLMMMPLCYPHHLGEPLVINSKLTLEVDAGND
jgi:hypothetical protein